MTYKPATLAALEALWSSHGGENLGVVGDAAHAARATYHNGLDRAIARLGTTNLDTIAANDYSFRLARDRAGASNAAMGIDLGALNGSLTELRRFSEWLVDQCVAGADPITRDIREVIFCTSDGLYIKRWSAVDQKVITSMRKTSTGWVVVNAAQGDASHAEHTHISWLRDSEKRGKVDLVARYFAPAPEPPPEDPPMPRILNADPADGIFTTLPTGATVFRVRDGADGPVGGGEPQRVVMAGTLEGFVDDGYFTREPTTGELYVFPKHLGTFVPTAAAGTPAPVDEAKIRKDERDRIAAAEAARIAGL